MAGAHSGGDGGRGRESEEWLDEGSKVRAGERLVGKARALFEAMCPCRDGEGVKGLASQRLPAWKVCNDCVQVVGLVEKRVVIGLA